LQQPAAFSTQVEKDTLERMRSAGVDIDMVIENVLSQRCDSLAGWWALLIEKEQRKEKRRERKRKEREAEAKSIRRLSAASARLLLAQSALGEIHESEELDSHGSPKSRGRRMTRPNGNLTVQAPDLPKVVERKSPTPDRDRHSEAAKDSVRRESRSRSRPAPPAPPPKDLASPVIRRPRGPSRGNSGSMLRYSTVNPDLLSPTYVPPPERSKRKTFYQQPLKNQLAWVKHWFKESAKRAKSPNGDSKKGKTSPKLEPDGKGALDLSGDMRNLQRISTGPILQHRKASVGSRPELQTRATMPARPRINTQSSSGSVASNRQKRTSLSPHTLTPHSSYRRSSGLRGRKSTSSSVSSVRSAYKGGHQHTHSKTSSTSSASLASPGGLSSASGSRMARSPHSSVKILPATPTSGHLPSGIRVSKRPPPGSLGTLPTFTDARGAFGNVGPGSPGLPVFARRKRSVFKGPIGGSPAGYSSRTPVGNGSRSGSVQGRPSGEMIMGITEEDEEAEEEMEDMEVEEVDQFGPELGAGTIVSDVVSGVAERDDELNSPLLPLQDGKNDPPGTPGVAPGQAQDGVKTPLTAKALAELEEVEEAKEAKGEQVTALQ